MEKDYDIKMKNGDVIHVPYEVYHNLCESMKTGVSTFVSYANKEHKYFLTINVNEIVYIK